MKCFWFTIIMLVHVTKANKIEAAAATVNIQNYDGPIYLNPGANHVILENLPPNREHHPRTEPRDQPSCQGHNKIASNHGQNLPSCRENHNPTLINLATTYDNQPNIYHNCVPYHQTICETDCKCLTKQQTCVPIAVNSVPQNTCSPGYYPPQCPEGYSYKYPDYTEAEVSCPKISETLIPLLKTYFLQNGTCKNCGLKH